MRWSGHNVEREGKTPGARAGSRRQGLVRAVLFLSCFGGFVGPAMSCGAADQVGGSFGEPPRECATAADCDDDDKCTTEKCVEAVCTHTDVKPDDENVCTTDACDPKLGVTHEFVPVDDGDVCTADACDPAAGVSHTPINPSDGDLCTIDSCDSKNGVTNLAIPIDDGDLCTVDACDKATGVVSHEPVPVDDKNVCTIDACDAATGTATHTQVSVDDGNGCTIDACDAVTGVSHTALPPCMQQVPESCSFVLCDKADGVCKAYDAAFADDFADNSAGWQLDTEWAIGPAKASSGQGVGNPDPSQDYDGAGANDNGVAGVVIGGNATPTNGMTYYMTSPVIDLSSLPASETVFLDLWRVLNTAAPALTKANIEVWNGNAWVQIWSNVAAVSDPTWQNVFYDVTSYKSAEFRVRFGIMVANGAPATSSWNIDHVRLIRKSDQGC